MNPPVAADQPGRERPGFWLRVGLLAACWTDPQPVIGAYQLLAAARHQIAELRAERDCLRALRDLDAQRIAHYQQWLDDHHNHQRFWWKQTTFWQQSDARSRSELDRADQVNAERWQRLQAAQDDNLRLLRENADLQQQLQAASHHTTPAGTSAPPGSNVATLPTRDDRRRPPDPAA